MGLWPGGEGGMGGDCNRFSSMNQPMKIKEKQPAVYGIKSTRISTNMQSSIVYCPQFFMKGFSVV